MSKKRKKHKRKLVYHAKLLVAVMAIAAILLIVLVSWVLGSSKKNKPAVAEPESVYTTETKPVPVPETESISDVCEETESIAESEHETVIQAESDPVPAENELKREDAALEMESQEAESQEAEVVVGEMNDAQDPQTSTNTTQDAGTGAVVEIVPAEMAAGETKEATLGIDVSKYQGTIDWAAVKSTGIDFAIVRVGYRTTETGTLTEDPGARYNLQEATRNGIKVGAYFFSTAITEAEAKEEATWVADFISKYKITYPVAYNCEGFNQPSSRQYSLTKQERSRIACVFLDTIAARGYTPMFYASRNEMEGSAQWDMSVLGSKYKVWVSQYPEKPFPETPASTYSGAHAMWQYTCNGKLYGVKGNVDINVAYFGYSTEAQAQDSTPVQEVTASPELGIDFTEVNEQVTAKNETNLRNIPSTQESQVVHLLKNGEVIQRTGIGSNGWDRVIYNGQILYAVHNYLITDLTNGGAQTATPSVTQAAADVVDGQRFTAVAEAVTARDKVNLRDKPSTETGNVVGLLQYGEAVVRTGISGTGDTGWSRLEVNGQVVYASSRLLATSMDYKEQEKPTAQNPEAGFHFTAATGQVKAKDVTNLRTLPTTNEPSVVAAQLSGDSTAVRVAVDTDKGWTKVNYNGQILYAVSNYLVVIP